MSDNTNTETKPAGKAPTPTAYHVRDRGEGQKSFWTRIGAAWRTPMARASTSNSKSCRSTAASACGLLRKRNNGPTGRSFGLRPFT